MSSPRQKAVTYYKNFQDDRAYIAMQLTAEEADIAATIAHRSYASPHTPEKPHGIADMLLARFRGDKAYVVSQLTTEETNIAATIANHSFASPHTREKPHGNAD